MVLIVNLQLEIIVVRKCVSLLGLCLLFSLTGCNSTPMRSSLETVKQIMSTVKNSPQMAVKLTRSQMSGLRNYLSKAQKMWFYSEDMDQEVWAATTRQGDQVKVKLQRIKLFERHVQVFCNRLYYNLLCEYPFFLARDNKLQGNQNIIDIGLAQG